MYSVSSRHLSFSLWGGTSTMRRSSLVARRERGAGWGFFLAGVSVILTLAAAGFFYIHQVTRSAVGGYDVSSLERRVTELKEEEQKLELQAAEQQSLKIIEQGALRLNFIPTENVAYTSPLVGGAVAFSGGREEF